MTDQQAQELWITLRFKGYADRNHDPASIANDLLANLQAHLERGYGHIPFAISQPGDVMDIEEEAAIYETQEPPQLFDHALSIAFSLRSEHPEGKDITPRLVRKAIHRRLMSLTDEEIPEATGAPFDSYEVDQSKLDPIPQLPAAITAPKIFNVNHEASDETYLFVDVAGIATVTIKRETEGIVVDIFPKGGTEPAASTYAFDSDLVPDDSAQDRS